MLVVGDFNTEIETKKERNLREDIAADIVTAGLEEMLTHFLPCHKSWAQDGITWCMQLLGKDVRRQTDYILGAVIRMFRKISARDPQNNSDHFMVLGCLRGETQLEHISYLG